MLRRPAIYHEQIAFTAQSSLWIAAAAGGEARRLTMQPRSETDASFSSTGEWIAFTAQYEGGPQVYRMPAAGGDPERLTHDLSGSFCLGWLPNDAGILVRSSRNHPQNRARIFSVPPEGGAPTLLPLPEAEFAAVHADGRIVFVPTSADAIAQRHYRGGKTDALWLKQGDDFEPLTDGSYIATTPLWLGDLVYFVGDQTGTPNLYVLDPHVRTVEQLTAYQGRGVASPKTDGKCIVFEHGDELVVYEPAEGTFRNIPIQVEYDPQPRTSRTQSVVKFLAGKRFELLSPRRHAIYGGGEKVLLELRGQILDLEVESGTLESRLYRAGSRCTFPAPSPAGREFAVVADLPHTSDLHDGTEQRLWLCDSEGKCHALTDPLPSFPEAPVWCPGGRWIALGDHALNIHLIDTTGQSAPRLVDRGKRGYTSAGINDTYCFSPDGKWLAYSSRGENWLDVVYLYELASGHRYAVTTPDVYSGSPAFSADGEWLYFLADVNFYLESSHTSFLDSVNVSSAVFKVPLERLAQFIHTSEPSLPLLSSEAGCTYDLSAWALSELRRVPLGDARPLQILAAQDLLLVLNEQVRSSGESTIDLYAYPLQTAAEVEEVLPLWVIPEVDEIRLSPERDALLMQTGEQIRCLQLAKPGGMSVSKAWVEDSFGARILRVAAPGALYTLDFQNGRLEVDPKAEWLQMLRETWRFTREIFWNPHFNGVDWDAVWVQYQQRLATVTDRLELNDLLTQLLAELQASHVKVAGGEVPGFGESLNIGYLGADLVPAPDGDAWKIARILRHDPYDPSSRSPLLAAGVSEGMYIHSVDGRIADRKTDIHQLLLGSAGGEVKLEIGPDPVSKEGIQTREVRALVNEVELRLQDWIASRRARVRERAGSTVGYVPIRDMLGGGLLEFARHYFAQRHCRALIIDVRNNEGGNSSNTILMHLAARIDSFLHARTGVSYPRANHAFEGAILVLCDETTVSNAEEFCAGVRTLGLGQVVGRRTQGAGVSPVRFSLLDHGAIQVPNVGIWAPHGDWIVEGKGVTPDIPVDYHPGAELEGDPILDRAIRYLLNDWWAWAPEPGEDHPPFPGQPAAGGD